MGLKPFAVLVALGAAIRLAAPGHAGEETFAASTPAGSPAAPTGAAPRAAITGITSWPSPVGTRIVVSFSTLVARVSPDSGLARSVLVAVPEPVSRSADVPGLLLVGDGIVDSVVTVADGQGARFAVFFRDSIRFRVLDLPPAPGRPYGLVIEAVKPEAALEERRRLEGIASQKKRERVRIVAVDAGHGGEDTGARSPRSIGILEKNVTLAVAKNLVNQLNQVPGLKAVLTRSSDYFIPLYERFRMAEKMKADVFISIHANSTRRRGSGSGTEVYFLSLRGASDQADADLADTENAADLVGGVPPQTGEELLNILYDVKRSSALQQSQLLAETVLDHVASDRRLESRGVKQAGFVVLKSVEFPSILVETAFINNPTEARLLKSKDFQLNIARQIADGVREYFKRAGIGLGGEGKPDSPGG